MPTKKEILDMLYYEPVMIGIWMGFKDLTDLHNEWLRSFLYEEEDQTLLGHRGSYKTTTLSIFIAIFVVIYPRKTLIFFRKTDTDVVEVITQAINILDSPVMKRLIKTLHGKNLVFVKKSGVEIDTNLKKSIKGSSQVLGLGIGTSITGKHADVVVTDDIVNLTDRISRAEREKTKTRYQELQNVKNRGGRFVNTGTPWHKEDAISDMPNVKRYDCYSTGLISREEIEKLRSKMTDSLFAANYELKHIAATDVIFQDPKFFNDETLIYGGIWHVDASYGGSDATAFTAFKKDSNGKIWGYGMRWEKHVDDCMADIILLVNKYRLGSGAVEKNADKGYLKKHMTEAGLYVHGYHEKMNKFIKISTYLKKEWSNIQWLEETDHEYINEILDYTETSAHDDSPDSAASLIRRLDKNEGWSS